MIIQGYTFGEMVIDGKRYTSDLMIYPDRIDAHWWRKTGHQLCPDDIQDILAGQPECLVVGTGNPGLMKVLPETRDFLQRHGIELIVQPTEQAYKTFNTCSGQKYVVGAFHLTC